MCKWILKIKFFVILYKMQEIVGQIRFPIHWKHRALYSNMISFWKYVQKCYTYTYIYLYINEIKIFDINFNWKYTNHEDILPGICLEIHKSYFWVPQLPSEDSIFKWFAWPVMLFNLKPSFTKPSLSLAMEWSMVEANFNSCVLKITY